MHEVKNKMHPFRDSTHEVKNKMHPFRDSTHGLKNKMHPFPKSLHGLLDTIEQGQDLCYTYPGKLILLLRGTYAPNDKKF